MAVENGIEKYNKYMIILVMKVMIYILIFIIYYYYYCIIIVIKQLMNQHQKHYHGLKHNVYSNEKPDDKQFFMYLALQGVKTMKQDTCKLS